MTIHFRLRREKERRPKLHQQNSHAFFFASRLFFHLCLDSRTVPTPSSSQLATGGKRNQKQKQQNRVKPSEKPLASPVSASVGAPEAPGLVKSTFKRLCPKASSPRAPSPPKASSLQAPSAPRHHCPRRHHLRQPGLVKVRLATLLSSS